jgi:hypothetical protein
MEGDWTRREAPDWGSYIVRANGQVINDLALDDDDAELIVRAVNAHDRLIEALGKIAADEWHSCRLEKACRLTSEHDPDCAIGIARAALALARGEVA